MFQGDFLGSTYSLASHSGALGTADKAVYFLEIHENGNLAIGSASS